MQGDHAACTECIANGAQPTFEVVKLASYPLRLPTHPFQPRVGCDVRVHVHAAHVGCTPVFTSTQHVQPASKPRFRRAQRADTTQHHTTPHHMSACTGLVRAHARITCKTIAQSVALTVKIWLSSHRTVDKSAYHGSHTRALQCPPRPATGLQRAAAAAQRARKLSKFQVGLPEVSNEQAHLLRVAPMRRDGRHGPVVIHRRNPTAGLNGTCGAQ